MNGRTPRIPKEFPFKIGLVVRIGDINYGGHVGHDHFFTLLHETRMQFLGQLGYSEKIVGGCGLILRDLEAQYHAQARHGDALEIGMAASSPGASGFDFWYEVTREEQAVLTARTGMACFDYDRQRVCRMPEELRRAMPWVEATG